MSIIAGAGYRTKGGALTEATSENLMIRVILTQIGRSTQQVTLHGVCMAEVPVVTFSVQVVRIRRASSAEKNARVPLLHTATYGMRTLFTFEKVFSRFYS